MIRYLLIAALVLTACGKDEGRKNDDSNHDLPLVKKPKEYNYIDSEKNLEISYSDQEKNSESIKKALAESKAWGTSIGSDFTPDLPLIAVEEAFTIKKDDPYHDKLASMLDDVLSRMKDRCPIFAEKRRWKPVVLTFEKTDDHLKWGGQLQMSNSKWSGSDNRYVSSYGYIFTDREERIVLWREEPKTFKDISGVDPWDYKIEHISQNMLRFSHYQPREDDVTLSHEISHWFVRSLFNEAGRIDIQTSYFSEVLAQWISAVCYVNSFEDKEFVKNETDNEEKKSPQKLWPMPNGVIDTTCLDTNNKWLPNNASETYSHAISSGCGLAGVLASTVYYDKFDSKKLIDSTVKAILQMNGKKVMCRVDDSSCYGIFSEVNTKAIKSDIQRPYVYTLGEFLTIIESKIEIPQKAMPMWNKYKEVILSIEK